jgi:hypothetical protein
MKKYIIVSLPRGYGKHSTEKDITGMNSDEGFTTNFHNAKKFDTESDAIGYLLKLSEKKEKDGFHGTFTIMETYTF